jgi:hypothetical protein
MADGPVAVEDLDAHADEPLGRHGPGRRVAPPEPGLRAGGGLRDADSVPRADDGAAPAGVVLSGPGLGRSRSRVGGAAFGGAGQRRPGHLGRPARGTRRHRTLGTWPPPGLSQHADRSGTRRDMAGGYGRRPGRVVLVVERGLQPGCPVNPDRRVIGGDGHSGRRHPERSDLAFAFDCLQ